LSVSLSLTLAGLA